MFSGCHHLEKVVGEGVDQLEVDNSQPSGGQELPQHPLSDTPPPGGRGGGGGHTESILGGHLYMDAI